MPAYLWITVAAAAAFVFWVGWGLDWWRSVRYSFARARHVIELTQSEPVPAPEYGSMIWAEEMHHEEWLPAPPVDPAPWLARTQAELAPEALDEIVLPDAGGWISGPCLDDPGPGEVMPSVPDRAALLRAQDDRDELHSRVSPGPGDDLSSLASSGPDQRLCGPEQPHEKPAGIESAGSGHPQPSRWLTEQLEILHAWSAWQQQKAVILT